MSTPSKTNSEADASGSRSWLEDDPHLSEEAHKAQWEEVRKGSDELLSYYWSSYGKWGYSAFAAACVVGGSIVGYRKGRQKEIGGVPVTKPVQMMAIKALAAGTALCATVTGLIAGSSIWYFDIKSIEDLQTRLRRNVPSLISPVPNTIEKLGLKTKVTNTAQPIEYESMSIDETMQEAFGKSDYYATFKPEDYKHQTDSNSKPL